MKSKLTKLTLSIILTLTIISLAVVLTLACKPLYYLDIHALHIPETTGCTISEIKANYNAVIDYCLSFGNTPLEFPTFPMSEGGRIHFEEVKNYLQSLQIHGYRRHSGKHRRDPVDATKALLWLSEIDRYPDRGPASRYWGSRGPELGPDFCYFP